MKTLLAITTSALLATGVVWAEEGHNHEHGEAATPAHAEETITVKGEVLDMACYLGHGAMGEKHAACAKTCMESGLPVGLKGENGTTYIVIGEHKPINDKLAAYAGKTVTLRGKATERDGIHLLSNAEIVK